MSKNLEMLIENYLMEKSSDISELLVPTDLKTFLYNYSKNNISNLIKDKKKCDNCHTQFYLVMAQDKIKSLGYLYYYFDQLL